MGVQIWLGQMDALLLLSHNVTPSPFEDLRHTPQDSALPLNKRTDRLHILVRESKE
jgi:hypothetical protein